MRKSRRMNGQRGASMVEFAISAMVMLMVVFGIIEFAQLLYSYHTVADAARLGTRWAIVRGADCVDVSCPAGPDDVRAYVRTQVPLLTASNVGVTTTWTNTNTCTAAAYAAANGPGCEVTVTVTYPFSFGVSIWGSGQVNLSSTSSMVISE
jgi:Flp pilus assembly protein TadG